MSKKKMVLIMDEPKNCGYCGLSNTDGVTTWCGATYEALSNSMEILVERDVKFRPSSCPLKDMPEYRLDWTKDSNSYGAGFNDALDAIGGSRR